jgi:SAM-dependent methyltransferase
MALPYEDNTLESVSCLSVIEHIGLGRYGDKVDPDGWKKACRELQRVLARNGRLYISVPIGKARICFNAHRVFSPENMIDALDGLKLLEFSSVDDSGNYLNTAKPSDFRDSDYSLGMYIFGKDAVK